MNTTPDIEARAEALCNLWGQDPNDPLSWVEALTTARDEWDDDARRAYAYPERTTP